VHNDEQLRAAIAPLRARGAQMAVDDMGAGYSGLGQIMAVHPRYLKLDRSLVRGIDIDSDRAALVGAVADYASRVGSLLIAEGMESASELGTLVELGVPLAQGFYLSRPGPPWPLVAPGLIARAAEPERRPSLPSSDAAGSGVRARAIRTAAGTTA
jgi:EAL domain-containing protein (putative c-di-GMP-specific phosphodiesterase class I)